MNICYHCITELPTWTELALATLPTLATLFVGAVIGFALTSIYGVK